MNERSKFVGLLAALALTLLGGCALTRSAVPMPALTMPENFQAEAAAPADAPQADWWRAFDSTELSSLIDEALRDSPDLAAASQRVLQAEAQLRIAGASLWPQLNAGVDSSRRSTDPRGAPSVRSDATSATLSASYEVDLWQRNLAGRDAATASLEGSRFDRESVRLTLVAGVADSYFSLLSLRDRLRIARENLAIAEHVFDIVEARARNGAVSQLDVVRQRSAVLAQQAALVTLELSERQTLHALAILLGRVPQGFDAQAASVLALQVPQVAPGLPSALLTRRPDVAVAEARLVAANADLAAARAALLPSLQLTTSAGVASTALLSLANPASTAYTLAASVMQPIFQGGRLRGQVQLAEARQNELVQNYRGAILAALADVENALVATSRTAAQQIIQTSARDAAQRALQLAEARYRAGADDLLSVLDAQRTLFSSEDQLAQTGLARLQAAVSLYKALGGGWQMVDGPLRAQADALDTPVAAATHVSAAAR